MHLASFLFEPGNKASMQLFQYCSISHIIVQKDTASQIIFIRDMKSLFTGRESFVKLKTAKYSL